MKGDFYVNSTPAYSDVSSKQGDKAFGPSNDCYIHFYLPSRKRLSKKKNHFKTMKTIASSYYDY